jgi:S1-C subfamily serine protease
VHYLEITPKIIGGNSGGPLVNQKFEALGVAVLGLNGKVDLKSTEFLAVDIKEIEKLPPV